MGKGMKKNILNIIFVAVMAVLLCITPVFYTIIDQRSSSESQVLTVFPKFTVGSFFDASFQTTIEQALKDQFFLHDEAIELTLGSKGGLHRMYNSIEELFGREKGLVPYGSVYQMFGTEYLTNLPYVYNEADAQGYIRKAGEISDFARKYPDAFVYVYYCTRAEDLDWFDESEGMTSFNYSAYLDGLLDDSVRFSASKIRDFEEFKQRRYQTDHHWTDTGADWGYIEILLMMRGDMPDIGSARSISNRETFDDLKWLGSRWRESALSSKNVPLESFIVSNYVLEDHITLFDGKRVSLGLGELYAEGEVTRDIGFDQYLNYFGFESAPIELTYEGNDKNLLIIGDSFVRTIRDPLASHFGTTLFINFRILDQVDLDELMAQYGFDAVLFMGQQDAFSGYFLEKE